MLMLSHACICKINILMVYLWIICIHLLISLLRSAVGIAHILRFSACDGLCHLTKVMDRAGTAS